MIELDKNPLDLKPYRPGGTFLHPFLISDKLRQKGGDLWKNHHDDGHHYPVSYTHLTLPTIYSV